LFDGSVLGLRRASRDGVAPDVAECTGVAGASFQA